MLSKDAGLVKKLHQEGVNLTDECREVVVDHVPYQPVVYIGVSVEQHVAESDDLLILDDSVSHRLIGPSKMDHCLADNLELTLHG